MQHRFVYDLVVTADAGSLVPYVFDRVGTVSFLLCAYVLCTTVVSDPVRAREHHAQVRYSFVARD